MNRMPSRTAPAALYATALAIAAVATIGCGSVADVQPRLRAAVDAKKPALDGCYDVALGRNREAGGELAVVIALASSSGRVEAVSVGASTIDDKDFLECVTSALRSVRVDPAPPVDTNVSYSLRFHASEPRSAAPEATPGGLP